jgi:hypothetical protein
MVIAIFAGCFTKQNQNKFIYLLGYALAFVWVILGTSCEGLFKKKRNACLWRASGMPICSKRTFCLCSQKEYPRQTVLSFVANYINNWATDQLLLDKAKINLSQEKLREFDNLVDNYRIDLYTRAYKEALVAKGIDSLFSENDIQEVYEKEKDNFRLKERIARFTIHRVTKNVFEQGGGDRND